MSSTTASPPAATLTEAFAAVVARRGSDLAVTDRAGDVTLTWTGLDDAARRVATGLAGLGVRPGDRVGLLLDNRPAFHVADLAVVLAGGVPVSIYGTSSAEQLAHIARDAGFAALLVQASHADVARAGVTGLDCPLVVLDAEPATLMERETNWETLTAAEPLADAAPVAPDDLLTIIYTSGTTGPPKGVELTHRNLLTATATIGAAAGVQEGDDVICWLPLAHIAERIASYYAPVVFGLRVTTCPDPRQIAVVLREVRPTWFFAVPRIWEKLRAGAQAAQQGTPALGPEQLRAALGLDRIRAANVGAAPIAPDVITYFHDLGVPLAEIYGMSENAACCTLNPRDDIRVGTVGRALPGVELRLAPDGEVLMRSATVMRGYRNRPEATAEAIDSDGWLHTGDVGELDGDGYLTIVDRKKELIINAAGKNMSPANIEASIKSGSPLIGQICVIGDRRPYNVALVVLDPDALAGRAPDDPAVVAEVQAAVDAGNARLSRVEQVRRHRILTEVWAPGGDELTPTMKLKRVPIAEKHAPEIEELYPTAVTS